MTTVLPRRGDHCSAIEAGTGNVLVFGGLDNIAGFFLNDTYSFNGVKWTKVTPAFPPPARARSAMATDTTRGLTVLFSGTNGAPDTWEWNGATWTLINTAASPVARAQHAMAFDPISNVVVLFGGNNGASLGDTWTYNGVNWTNVTPALSPAPRENHTMEFDPLTSQILLFGGFSAATGPLGDTWSFNTATATWTQLNPPAPTPPAREDHAMTFDVGSNVMLLSGGATGATVLGDEWTWNGTSWTQIFPTNPPPSRRAHGLDWGPRGSLVLTGGVSGLSLIDFWTRLTSVPVFGGNIPAVFDRSANGCPSAPFFPSLTSDTAAILGSTFVMDLSGFDPSFPFATVSIGFAPQTQSCVPPLALGHVSANTVTISIPNGAGQFNLAIPNNPSLAGTLFFSQAFSQTSSSVPIATNQIITTAGF